MTRAIYMPGVCRECNCDDLHPCPGGCVWVEEDLCSACAGAEPLDAGDDQELLEDEP